MQKIKAATYVLAMLFLGLLIGGAIAGNKAAWICGLVFLILDVICGITIHRRRKRRLQISWLSGCPFVSSGKCPQGTALPRLQYYSVFLAVFQQKNLHERHRAEKSGL